MGPRVRKLLMLAALTAPALSLGGCSGFSRAIGAEKTIPNEFEVITKAPLVIPPDFSLKPPAPGAERGPQTEAELIAQRAMLGEGQAYTPGMTPGERALVAAAGATHSDPMIRQVVDQEYANLISKGDDFAERLIFWEKRPGATAATTDQVEGQKPVTIKKDGGIF